jgi:hypothetical protein
VHHIPTYTADIYVGAREGYSDKIREPWEFNKCVSDYVNEVKLAATITHLNFQYVDGNEPGVKVGLINYPRFPKSRQQIRDLAFSLAEKLKAEFKQERVTIVFPDDTVMLGEL